MKLFSLMMLAACLITSMAWSAPKKPVSLMQKAQNLATEAFGADMRKIVTRTEEGICGSEGPSYIIQVQVRHFDKELNQKTGAVDLIPRYETVKAYGISELELARQTAPVLMDEEACME